MVVMVAGEVLGELVARELGARDDAVHHAGVLEQLQVAVRTALREAGLGVEDLGDRERATGRCQHIDERVACGRSALSRSSQPRRHSIVERVERGHGEQV
jgi:hypothetical protein